MENQKKTKKAYLSITGTKKKAIVDADILPFLKRWKWQINVEGYVCRSTSVFIDQKRIQTKILLHRQICGHLQNYSVDHKDGDRLNNTIENLRFCTQQLQAQNRKNVKGAYYNKGNKCWVSSIRTNGKRTYLGNFKSEEEALTAYRNAKTEREQYAK